jgi:hypothetical protein
VSAGGTADVDQYEVAMDDVEAFDDEGVASDVGEWKDSFGMLPHPGTHSVHCSRVWLL